LHGVCLHHDLGCLGAAHNYRALERQVILMKSYGINAIRTSHNPPAPQLLEICNRLGIMIMDEVFDCWSVGKVPYDYAMYFNSSAQQDVTSWVLRDRNQPCLIMWSIGNEIPDYGSSSGVTAATNILKWLKALDNTHKTVCGYNGSMPTGVPNMLDAVGYNYGTGADYDADHGAHPNWVLIGSETASSYRSRGVYHFPITQNNTNADYQCNEYDNNYPGWGTTAENSWIIDRDRKFVAGQFIWTGFDYIGEPKPYQQWPARSSYFGIIDLAGFPKDIYYFYQSQWTTKPMVHLLPQNWNWTSGMNIPVWAFSNCDSVRLIVNGVTVGTKKKPTVAPLHQAWNVPFVAGKIKAYGYMGGVVVAKDSVVTAGTPVKLLTKVDRDTIRIDGLDVAFVEVNVLDANGTQCPTTETLVNFTLTGPGKIIGTDNGNAISHESFLSPNRKTFNGKCIAVVQSTGMPGKIVVTASSTNSAFTSTSVTINGINTPVRVDELKSATGMLLYPNPTSSVLYLQLSEAVTTRELVEVFDLMGQKLQTRMLESGQSFMQLDIAELKTGLYFLKYKGQTEKFIINK
jgi:beta-galactosidase